MTSKASLAIGLALAVALVVPATAATPKAGSWSGQTKQNKSISFSVTSEGKKVKSLKVGFKGSCENGASVTGQIKFSGKFPIQDGKFKAQAGNSVVKGEFTSKKKAEGTLKYNSTTFDPVTFRTVECHSGKVRWNAHH
jgi:hypothetical protein